MFEFDFIAILTSGIGIPHVMRFIYISFDPLASYSEAADELLVDLRLPVRDTCCIHCKITWAQHTVKYKTTELGRGNPHTLHTLENFQTSK